MAFFSRTLRAGFVLGLWSIGASPVSAATDPDVFLARVDVPGPVAAFPLPVHAQLQDAAGGFYLLVKATAVELEQTGRAFYVLDSNAGNTSYLLARAFRPGARQAAQGRFAIVHDDGRRLLVRTSAPADAEALSLLGFQCRGLPAAPLRLDLLARTPAGAGRQAAVTSNAWVAAMLAQIRQTNLYNAMAELTGVQPAVASGSYTNIRTRHQNSAAALRRATDFAFECFLALGLQPSFQPWSAAGISNRNVIATLPGTTASAEVVVVCAHIDNMPSGSLAPGADDNASGSVGVLAAAEALRKYAFERTLRFVIFTGEEQGLYGSEAHAAAADAANENLVAVLNLDMIAWDGNSDKILNLYVRPGNTAEIDTAATFTNVARVYGLNDSLKPVTVAETTDWSDHHSFHAHGFPAICVIEEDVIDFNPYYHTTNDTLARLHLPFFTRSVQAVAGTAAHLARPVQRVSFDSVQVQNGAFLATTNVGVGTFLARHEAGGAEGADTRDIASSALATNPNPAWLKIHSDPYATALAVDARPADSETIFRGKLTAVKTAAGNLTCTNRLRFSFAPSAETNCTYLVRVTVASNATPGRTAFECTTNLADLIAAGGFLRLPGLSNVPNGTVYGTCEIARRFVAQTASNLVLGLPQVTASNATLTRPCQPGIRVIDTVEFTTNLFPAAPWLPLGAFTSAPAPDAASFESGWTSVDTLLDLSATGDGNPARYLRVRRNWPAP